jgi:hypothetical protein
MIAHGLLYRVRRWLCHAGFTSVTSLDRYRAIPPIAGRDSMYVIKVGSLYVQDAGIGLVTLTELQKDARRYDAPVGMADIVASAGGRFVHLKPKARS